MLNYLSILGLKAVVAGKKGKRPTFNSTQMAGLTKAYNQVKYINGIKLKELSGQLHLSPMQVKIWFQNHRQKDKKLKVMDSLSFAENHENESTKEVPGGSQYHNDGSYKNYINDCYNNYNIGGYYGFNGELYKM